MFPCQILWNRQHLQLVLFIRPSLIQPEHYVCVKLNLPWGGIEYLRKSSSRDDVLHVRLCDWVVEELRENLPINIPEPSLRNLKLWLNWHNRETFVGHLRDLRYIERPQSWCVFIAAMMALDLINGRGCFNPRWSTFIPCDTDAAAHVPATLDLLLLKPAK